MAAFTVLSFLSVHAVYAPETRKWSHSLIVVVLTLVVSLLWVTLTPLLFVLLKWTVIWHLSEGTLFNVDEHYLRWWFIDVLRTHWTRNMVTNILSIFYYRLLRHWKEMLALVWKPIFEYDL
jgi:hypothetical protein